MEIQLSKDTKNKLNEVSSILGIRDRDVVNRALLFYLDTISKQLELKREMASWDYLSDEALAKFDKLI
ncbi:hypothetical protein J4480_04645 [Candidatus Woesearchaeota archaeon]|nr:hypothetical protein [Candidatus Woesearchaeota archaeon]